MAKVKYSEFVEDLDAADALDGTESVVVLQDGVPVETTTQDIADLGIVETTGTITGTDAVLVSCFPIPDTSPYSISGSAIVKCTDAGAGTVVVGECFWYILASAQINDSTIENTDENQEASGQTSMAETIVALEDINSGQLRISITPPFDTAAAGSEFSYKIRLSGFSL